MTADFAKKRNWLRFRLAGIHFTHEQTALMTAEESELLMTLMATRTKLMEGWDENTKKLGGHLKPYKCWSCGRRSNKSYQIEGYNYCKKHFDTFSTEYQTILEGIKREEYDNTDNDTGRNTILDRNINRLVGTSSSSDVRDKLFNI